MYWSPGGSENLFLLRKTNVLEPQRLRTHIFIQENMCFGAPEAQKTNFD
jgi:hypothetical protein